MFDPDDSKTLVTCGKEHVYFWRLHNTRLERKNGYFEVHYDSRFTYITTFGEDSYFFGHSTAVDQRNQKGHHCHYSGFNFEEKTLGPAAL